MATADSWLRGLIDRCQEVCLTTSRRPLTEIVDTIHAAVLAQPARLTQPEQAVARHVLVRTLLEMARQAHVDTCAEIANSCVRIASGTRLPTDIADALAPWRQATCIPAAARSRVRLAAAFIGERFADPGCSLRRVASHAGLSACHLTRLLKQQTGCGFVEHLHRARVSAARRLLSGTIMSVKEVAVAVGYSSTRQLDRHFRRLCGMTPGEFREASPREAPRKI